MKATEAVPIIKRINRIIAELEDGDGRHLTARTLCVGSLHSLANDISAAVWDAPTADEVAVQSDELTVTLKTALTAIADCVRRPMGVKPDSAYRAEKMIEVFFGQYTADTPTNSDKIADPARIVRQNRRSSPL